MIDPLDTLITRWARLGAGFGAEPSAQSPDLERVLLDTARHAHRMSRLFIMGATWLHRYGEFVAKHRLRRLIREELAPEHRPVLALLLDIAQRGTHPARFASIIKDISPHTPPGPLSDVERSDESLAARSLRRASDVSRAWGLWCEPIEFKDDALRPPPWVMSHNPGFIVRADFRGDLRASILAALAHDMGAGTSELQLARCAGGSRAQVRNALANLELTGRVSKARGPTSRRLLITAARAA